MSTPGSLWSRLAGLPLRIEQVELETLRLRVPAGWERLSTQIALHGAGETGLGEDVVYEQDEHAEGRPPRLAVEGDWTLASFCDHVAGLDLFPAGAPERPDAARPYRRWAWESAALDLALRQAGTDLATALGRPAQPVNFVSSARLGEVGAPPTLRNANELVARVPSLRFKLDADATWDERFTAELAAFGRVDCVDFKAYYKGTIVDVDISPEQTLAIARALPQATLEDVAPGEATELLVQDGHGERLAWDAPIHSWDDIAALPITPRRMNIKPSRIGSIEALLGLYERLEADGVAMYGGGQFEIGAGRGQIILLASIFHPTTANDVAPAVYHLPGPDSVLPAAPLSPPQPLRGFRWPAEA